MNKHCWNWFYNNVRKESNRFYGVEITFIYCGVIITNMNNNNRAEFCDDDFIKLFDDVQMYMIHNFKRRVAVIHIHTSNNK